MRHDLAELLRPWLAYYGRDEHPFSAMPERTARMLRDDLEETRRRWLDEATTDTERQQRERSDFLKHTDVDGRVLDFHGTRHTYISGIVASGASVKTCQELARHSTPTLTIGRYSHARLHDLQGALEALPDTTPQKPGKQPELIAATGTDGLIETESCGQMRGQYNRKSTQDGANRGEPSDGCRAVESSKDHGQDAGPNVLSLRDLAGSETHAANRRESGWERIRTPGGLSPTAVFKTAALDHSATHPIRCFTVFS